MTSLRERFRGGLPVITSELVPPRGADANGVREQVATLAAGSDLAPELALLRPERFRHLPRRL